MPIFRCNVEVALEKNAGIKWCDRGLLAAGSLSLNIRFNPATNRCLLRNVNGTKGTDFARNPSGHIFAG